MTQSARQDAARSLRAGLPVAGILVLLWLGSAAVDRIWLARDRSIPTWDPTHHLTGSLNYLHAVQTARWFDGDWWRELWMLSSKNPPLTYIVTAVPQQLFAPAPDTALLVNLGFSALLLVAVGALGRHLYDSHTALWAAAICLVLPALYDLRLNYLTDYPLVALVATGFWCLTVWCDAQKRWRQWLWALAVGVCFGLGLLTKQSVLFFLTFPGLWILVAIVRRRAWGRLLQVFAGLLIASFICLPWYRTNWIFFLGAYQSGIASAARAEGDPPLHTLAAWTHYAQLLPTSASWVLLLVPLVSFLLCLGWHLGWLPGYKPEIRSACRPPVSLRGSPPLFWLLYFWGGSYLLCSALVNKDSRYIAPYLPILALIAARGLQLFPQRWAWVRWGTLGLATGLMLLHLFPLNSGLANAAVMLSPNPLRYPARDVQPPQPEIVAAMTEATPHLQTTLGMVYDSAAVNHNNVNYYGALADRQVYGREVGRRDRHFAADARNLHWFLLPDSGTLPADTPRRKLAALVETSPEFAVAAQWTLPEGNARLYRRRQLPVRVEAAPVERESVVLQAVDVPAIAPPGAPVPVTYTWEGPSEALQRGVMLLTWQAADGEGQWLHDGAIARGELFDLADRPGTTRVIDQTAMLPPADLPPGTYALAATYLDRETGEAHPLPHPTVRLRLAADAPAVPAPPLDRVSILRQLARDLPQGRAALDPVFDTVGQINQYDPVQDYVRQAELALRYRWQQEPEQVDWAYALALTQILQEDAQGAVPVLEQVAALDAQNPYAHAYLTFIHLYRWQPGQARAALQPALAIAPDLPEVQLLDGVTAFMELNWLKAWRVLEPLLTSDALASGAV